jgi:hypothetical protein
MSAAIVPFPIARRRAFIAKQAHHAAELNADSGVRYLQHQIKIQGDAMRRKGIDEDLIQRELRCMAHAIRAAFIQDKVQQPGGDA